MSSNRRATRKTTQGKLPPTGGQGSKVPGIDLSNKQGEDSKEDSASRARRFSGNPDDVMKPRSHRDVSQGPNTCFKIIPEQWNNVPKIVYEAIASVIETLDKTDSGVKQQTIIQKKFVQENKSSINALNSLQARDKDDTNINIKEMKEEVDNQFEEFKT